MNADEIIGWAARADAAPEVMAALSNLVSETRRMAHWLEKEHDIVCAIAADRLHDALGDTPGVSYTQLQETRSLQHHAAAKHRLTCSYPSDKSDVVVAAQCAEAAVYREARDTYATAIGRS